MNHITELWRSLATLVRYLARPWLMPGPDWTKALAARVVLSYVGWLGAWVVLSQAALGLLPHKGGWLVLHVGVDVGGGFVVGWILGWHLINYLRVARWRRAIASDKESAV